MKVKVICNVSTGSCPPFHSESKGERENGIGGMGYF
jgi:hypothetical protein